ncbi:MAG: DUF4129 domain-containing protein [Candidatus Merdivicinus sp.]|jgi:hypothetical protein
MKLRFPLLPVIKGAAVLCFVFPFLPVFALLALPLSIPVTERYLGIGLICFVFSAFVGMMAGVWGIPELHRRNGQIYTVLANLLSLGVAILCGGISFAAFWAAAEVSPLYIALTGGILSLICSMIGCRIWERNYDEILTARYLIVLTVLDAVCCFIFWLMKEPLSLTILSLTFLTSACVYTAAKNQGNIDYLMEKRNNRSTSILPKRMRWYSFSLVGIIFVLIFAGYFLRKQIAAILMWILNLLKMLLAALLSLLPTGEEPEVVQQQMPQGNQGDMMLSSETGGPSFFWTLFGFAFAAFLIWLAFFYRREIWNGICMLFAKIRDFSLGWLFHNRSAASLADVNQYFEDNVEELGRIEHGVHRKQKPYDLRRWKKEYRLFRSMREDDYRLREGYRLALQYLRLRQVLWNPSDTPYEILEKARKILPEDLFACVTEGYCRVRYAEDLPHSEELTALEKVLAGISA